MNFTPNCGLYFEGSLLETGCPNENDGGPAKSPLTRPLLIAAMVPGSWLFKPFWPATVPALGPFALKLVVFAVKGSAPRPTALDADQKEPTGGKRLPFQMNW